MFSFLGKIFWSKPGIFNKQQELTEQEKADALKHWQSLCKHKTYITNTVGPSKCASCGKPLY